MLWCLIFVQKTNFQENFRKISQNSYFTRILTEPENETEGDHEGPTPTLGAGQALAAPRGGLAASATQSASPPDYIKPHDLKTEGGSTFFQKEFRCSAATRNPNPGTRSSVLAPYRDRDLEEIIAIAIMDASPSSIHDSPIHV